jgi:hypothetical protein
MAGLPERRGTAAPSRTPIGDGPGLRVVGPPSRHRRPWSIRPTLVVVVTLVLGSLLCVAGAQAYLTQQSVRLGQVQSRLDAQVGEHRDLELQVAQLSNPSHLVNTAQSQGYTVPAQVTDLPAVTVPPPVTTSTTPVPTRRAHRSTPAHASGAGSR